MVEATAGGAPHEPSPLDALPGLVDVVQRMDDIVVVTDLHRRVVVWNRAAERQYGIPAADADGATIDTLFDTTIIGEATTASGARTMALAGGTWRGRVAERPLIGRHVGHELVIDAVLNRLDDAAGQPVGVLSVEARRHGQRPRRTRAGDRHLAGLRGVDSRTRQGAADRALDVLLETTGAVLAGIAIPVDGALHVLAQRGASEGLTAAFADVKWAESPAVRAITPVGRVVKGAVSLLPLAPTIRRAMLDARHPDDRPRRAPPGRRADRHAGARAGIATTRSSPRTPSSCSSADHLARGTRERPAGRGDRPPGGERARDRARACARSTS